MNTNKRYPKWPIVLMIIGIALLVGAVLMPSDAQAHTPDPAACTYLRDAAPPGDKYAAQQRCIAAQRAHNYRHRCGGPLLLPARARVKGVVVDAGQRHVITWVLNEARRRGASYKVLVATVAATTQEATARELRGGTGSSAGPFQLISSWGPLYLRQSVEFSGDWFLDRAIPIDRRRPWLSTGQLAQAVEASSYPTAYSQWVPEARRTVALLLGSCGVSTRYY